MSYITSVIRGKKTSKDFTDQEKKDVIKYLEDHADDSKAFEYLMNKYNCSNTTISIICVQKVIESDKKYE